MTTNYKAAAYQFDFDFDISFKEALSYLFQADFEQAAVEKSTFFAHSTERQLQPVLNLSKNLTHHLEVVLSLKS